MRRWLRGGWLPGRAEPVPVPEGVAPGERVLAWCRTSDGVVLAGTRDALHLPDRRVPWEDVQAAEWERDSETLVVSEVGEWGQPRPEHRFVVGDEARFLQLVRERVTASILIQRHEPVRGRRGVRAVARRAPRGDQPVRWLLDYDEGVDPSDPVARAAAERALAAAQEQVGL